MKMSDKSIVSERYHTEERDRIISEYFEFRSELYSQYKKKYPNGDFTDLNQITTDLMKIKELRYINKKLRNLEEIDRAVQTILDK